MIKESILHYCQYQERSHKEVRNKLYELGCTTPEVEENIAELIEKDVLNEERFARAIARGKFNMKQWGKRKIIEQLKFQQVSEYCIKKALKEIDYDEYLRVAKKLIVKKLPEYKGEKKDYIIKQKLYRYLAQKGYETEIINIALNETLSNNAER